MLSDIEIAQQVKMLPVTEIAEKLGIDQEDLELYGKYKAKLSYDLIRKVEDRKPGKLVLVTAITPTPAGEGKSTTTVGLAQGLQKIGKKVIVALREPSLGPCFGIKGGAAGGGYSQVVPMEDINLHFTGDFHAITSAHALRNIVIGLGGKAHGVPREDGFDITVASEVMAILCLASNLHDLKERLKRIVVAYNYDGKPVTAEDLHAAGAMAALLKDAVKPNLVQTLEHVPAIIHGGPFANIAHGCNSVMATRTALRLADFTITEAGFGADLGAEKFFDIKCRQAGLAPDACVLVATVRALKMHGGVAKADLKEPNVEAVKKGLPNLGKHIENIFKFGVPVVVAINIFAQDTKEELQEGGVELAKEVVALAESGMARFKPIYPENMSLREKVATIVKEVYGGDRVEFQTKAAQALDQYEKEGYGNLPVCMAKTQYSLSDDPALLGAPSGFTVNVKNAKISAGAGFIVIYTGDIMTMPGLPKKPAAESIDVTDEGKISGLF